jgi:hypothetical protein
LSLLPRPLEEKLLAGSTWVFQTWYRDGGSSGAGFNFSSALRLTLAP